ncbi:DUF1648 domain-containing protein [Corynebacterium sp. A21]|uniref:DUF1648 domain-containing protein n=1 Tax=Corynebacterium sp. A21 TaxID=3457318 RepID=UPI003FD3786C
MTKTTGRMPNLPKIPMDWKWIIATVVSTALMVAVLVVCYYPGIPDPMPVHWNAAGEADGFQKKSMGGFLGTILLGPGILVLSLAGAEAMISMQSGHLTGPGGAKTPNEAHRTWLGYQAMLKHLGWYMFALNLLIMLMLLNSYRGNFHRLELAISLVLILALTLIFLRCLLRERNAAEAQYPRPEHEQGKTWGIFHNDPEDSRILVDTGSGTNFTFNIGRPVGRILAILLFGVLPLGMIVLVVFSALAG